MCWGNIILVGHCLKQLCVCGFFLSILCFQVISMEGLLQNRDARDRREERWRSREEGNPTSEKELALFHTGAILSSLGYCPPATATWEHLREDRCVWKCVCVVVSDNTFTTDLLSPSVTTTVQSATDLEANLLECVSRNFPLCWGYLCIFLLQPLLNVIGACTAIC